MLALIDRLMLLGGALAGALLACLVVLSGLVWLAGTRHGQQPPTRRFRP